MATRSIDYNVVRDLVTVHADGTLVANARLVDAVDPALLHRTEQMMVAAGSLSPENQVIMDAFLSMVQSLLEGKDTAGELYASKYLAEKAQAEAKIAVEESEAILPEG